MRIDITREKNANNMREAETALQSINMDLISLHLFCTGNRIEQMATTKQESFHLQIN